MAAGRKTGDIWLIITAKTRPTVLDAPARSGRTYRSSCSPPAPPRTTSCSASTSAPTTT
ncbi:hypothetical protein ACWDE9_41175 [Streptomyces olivaceoviridis]